MKHKGLLGFSVAIILAIIIVVFFLYQTNITDNNKSGLSISDKCGDGICDDIERGACPEDCVTETTTEFDHYLYNDDEDYLYERDEPVYVTFYTHNEDSWQYKVNTFPKYVSYREDLIDRAELFAEYDVPWNWQTDQPVVDATILYEANEDTEIAQELFETSNGMNLLMYIESIGAQLDPHAHKNNYADIVYLIESLGANPSSVIGGTIIQGCGKEHLRFLDFENWWINVGISPDGLVYGRDYSTTWEPLILSDPGMGGHYFDEWTSGIWKPGKGDDFYTHDNNRDIIYVGEGYPHDVLNIGTEHSSGSEVHAENGQYIIELVEKIANGEAPTGISDGREFMYTASVHYRDTEIVTDGGNNVNTLEAMEEFLDILQPYVDSGQIVYVNFEEAVDIWETEYNSVPWQYGLESFSFYDEVKDQAETYCTSRMP